MSYQNRARSISGRDLPGARGERPKSGQRAAWACLCGGLLVFVFCAAACAADPPPGFHTPSGDSLLILETFDYPDRVGEFPHTWGAKSGWRTADEREIYYKIQSENGDYFLQGQTLGSAINAGYEKDINLRVYNQFRWRWRVFSLPEGGNETIEDKNDSAAAVYLVFHGGIIPKALKYVWSATLPKGTETESAGNSKVKVVVLESGKDKLGQWVWEEVDAYADYKRIFGGEPRPVRGIAVITDSDNTRSFVMADYDDFAFLKAPPEAPKDDAPAPEISPDSLRTRPASSETIKAQDE